MSARVGDAPTSPVVAGLGFIPNAAEAFTTPGGKNLSLADMQKYDDMLSSPIPQLRFSSPGDRPFSADHATPQGSSKVASRKPSLMEEESKEADIYTRALAHLNAAEAHTEESSMPQAAATSSLPLRRSTSDPTDAHIGFHQYFLLFKNVPVDITADQLQQHLTEIIGIPSDHIIRVEVNVDGPRGKWGRVCINNSIEAEKLLKRSTFNLRTNVVHILPGSSVPMQDSNLRRDRPVKEVLNQPSHIYHSLVTRLAPQQAWVCDTLSNRGGLASGVLIRSERKYGLWYSHQYAVLTARHAVLGMPRKGSVCVVMTDYKNLKEPKPHTFKGEIVMLDSTDHKDRDFVERMGVQPVTSADLALIRISKPLIGWFPRDSNMTVINKFTDATMPRDTDLLHFGFTAGGALHISITCRRQVDLQPNSPQSSDSVASASGAAGSSGMNPIHGIPVTWNDLDGVITDVQTDDETGETVGILIEANGRTHEFRCEGEQWRKKFQNGNDAKNISNLQASVPNKIGYDHMMVTNKSGPGHSGGGYFTTDGRLFAIHKGEVSKTVMINGSKFHFRNHTAVFPWSSDAHAGARAFSILDKDIRLEQYRQTLLSFLDSDNFEKVVRYPILLKHSSSANELKLGYAWKVEKLKYDTSTIYKVHMSTFNRSQRQFTAIVIIAPEKPSLPARVYEMIADGQVRTYVGVETTMLLVSTNHADRLDATLEGWEETSVTPLDDGRYTGLAVWYRCHVTARGEWRVGNRHNFPHHSEAADECDRFEAWLDATGYGVVELCTDRTGATLASTAGFSGHNDPDNHAFKIQVDRSIGNSTRARAIYQYDSKAKQWNFTDAKKKAHVDKKNN